MTPFITRYAGWALLCVLGASAQGAESNFPQRAVRSARFKLIENLLPGEVNPGYDFTLHPLDADLADMSPARRARSGLSRTFQSLELFEDLTVLDNLLAAASQPSWSSVLRDLVLTGRGAAVGREQAQWALHVLGIEAVANRMPGELSHGQRKLVGVARALAMKPQLVLLDEPAAGLDTAETAAMAERVRGLAQHGIAVLLVDHDMSLVASVCDRVVVLDLGTVIATGAPAEVLANPAVVAAYLGSTAASEAGR